MKDIYKKIIRVTITIIVFIAIIIGLYFILKAFGVTDQESLQKIINDTGVWGPIVFLLLQIAVTTVLAVIPGTSMTFLVLAGILFDNIWLALGLSLVGVWISSILMFVIGDTLGEKVAIKLIGKDSLRKAQELIDTKTKIYLPIMFLFPFFPDDGLCLAAGLTKLKYSFFIPVVLIFRSTGVVAAVLSSFYHKNIFEFLGLKSLAPIEWILLVNILIFDVFVIFKFTRWLEKKINQRKQEQKEIS